MRFSQGLSPWRKKHLICISKNIEFFLFCKTCLGKVNFFPERGSLDNEMDSHMRNTEHTKMEHLT